MTPFERIAERHQARGDAYAAACNLAFAEGSWAKAQKAREKARHLLAALGDPHGPPTQENQFVQDFIGVIGRRMVDDFGRILLGDAA